MSFDRGSFGRRADEGHAEHRLLQFVNQQPLELLVVHCFVFNKRQCFFLWRTYFTANPKR